MSQNVIKKDEIVFVTACEPYIVDGIEKSGYRCIRPYKHKNIIDRVLREAWFRLPLSAEIWFNKEIMSISNIKYIIVHDPQITKEYLNWLTRSIPKAKIIYHYRNLVGNARHLFPKEIPDGIDIWTYDDADAKKYHIRKAKSGGYCQSYIGNKGKELFDIFYIGKDKGRGEKILSLKKNFEDLGLKTKFIITKDSRYSREKPYYSKAISYHEVIEYDNHSRAILNIVFPGQTGATMRDYESIYNNVKIITNNKYAINFEFYNKNNYFILGVDSMDKLTKFVRMPFQPIDKIILKHHTIDALVRELVNAEMWGDTAIID